MNLSAEWGFLKHLAFCLSREPTPQGSPGSREWEPGFDTSSLGCQDQRTVFSQMPGKAPTGPAPTLSRPGNVGKGYKFPSKAPCYSLPWCTCFREPGQPELTAASHLTTPSSGQVPTAALGEGGQMQERERGGGGQPRPRACPDMFIFIEG